MADQFSQVTTTGFGQRILGSIVGIPVGLVLIIAGIGLLYWNEGRFDTSKLAKTAIEIQATQQAPASAEGKLVAVKGTVTAAEPLGDAYLKPGAYLALNRKSEMFAWIEESSSSSQNHTGGSQTNTTTYTYKTAWTDTVANSANFKDPNSHINPVKTIDSNRATVQQASIGSYAFAFANLRLPELQPLQLTADNSILPDASFKLTSDGKLYKGVAYETPQVGDARISYSALGNNFVGTVFGRLSGASLETYTDSKNHSLYGMFTGSKQDAVVSLHKEFTLIRWLIRGGGFLAILFGLSMLLGPITTVLSFFPTLGAIGSGAVMFLAFPIALLLSGVTIIIGMIARSPVALGVALLLCVVASSLYIKLRANKHSAA